MSISTSMTVQRHILESQKSHPAATGEFTGLLYDIMTAAKIINSEVNKAGLADILGYTGHKNIQGESVQKLDEFANEAFYRVMNHGGHVCVMATEEEEFIVRFPGVPPKGKYALNIDPLDGSSNIDANVSVGSIFSILKRRTLPGTNPELNDCLQKGYDQIGAGYVLYGSSTMLVLSTGDGVHGYTYDPSVGEFFLSHENIQIPPSASIYSVNEGNFSFWDRRIQDYVMSLKYPSPDRTKPMSLRYIGSLVADFHRNMLYGGIFMYPADAKSPYGKLRLLYEANPLAYLAEQAGGYASDGVRPILGLEPFKLHQRTPLFIGSIEDVKRVEQVLKARA